jgi:hypothetical protein
VQSPSPLECSRAPLHAILASHTLKRLRHAGRAFVAGESAQGFRLLASVAMRTHEKKPRITRRPRTVSWSVALEQTVAVMLSPLVSIAQGQAGSSVRL